MEREKCRVGKKIMLGWGVGSEGWWKWKWNPWESWKDTNTSFDKEGEIPQIMKALKGAGFALTIKIILCQSSFSLVIVNIYLIQNPLGLNSKDRPHPFSFYRYAE